MESPQEEGCLNGVREGSLGKEEVKEIIARVENFVGEQTREVASLIGVSTVGINKDVRSTFGRIQGT